MPSADTILVGLTAVANQWRPLAIGWHVALAALMLAMLGGWRPSNRAAVGLLTLPLLSVSGMAWASGNPFNGTTFASLALLVAWFAAGLSTEAVRLSSPPVAFSGALLLMFGWTYPHFLAAERWTDAAPLSGAGVLGALCLSSAFQRRRPSRQVRIRAAGVPAPVTKSEAADDRRT
jgi:hypothetical protein